VIKLKTNIDENWSFVKSLIMNKINDISPKRRTKISSIVSEAWIDSELKAAKKLRNENHRQYISSRNPSGFELFKK
jgi:hypothetical protein